VGGEVHALCHADKYLICRNFFVGRAGALYPSDDNMKVALETAFTA
jgi:hypothetical protein